jgi:hypothetical protein
MGSLQDRVTVKTAAMVCGRSEKEMTAIFQKASAEDRLDLDADGCPTWGAMLNLMHDYPRDPAVEAAENLRYATRMRAAARAGKL